MDDVLLNIFDAISYTKHTMIKEDIYDDKESGVKRIRKSEYEVKISDNSIQDRTITGSFIRFLPVFLNKKDENGNIYTSPEENYEIIRFHMDLANEIIVFYTTNRFGYKQFQENFESYINEIMYINKKENEEEILDLEEIEIPKYVILNFITTSYKIDEFRKLLIEKGNITDISYSFIFPNGNDDLIDGLNNLTDGLIEQYKKAQINQIKKEIISNTDNGLVINSTPIDDFFSDVQNIKKGLEICNKDTEEECLDPGYLEINARTKLGESLSTQDEYIYTREISNVDKNEYMFKKVAVEAINIIKTIFL